MSDDLVKQILVELKGMRKQMNQLQSNQEDTKFQVNQLRVDLQDTRSEVIQLRVDQHDMKEEMNLFRVDQHNVKDELNQFRAGLLDTKVVMDKLNFEQQNTRAQMNSRFDTLELKLSFVQRDVSVIKQDTSDLKVSVGHLEKNEPADVIGMLKYIKEKLDGQKDLSGKVRDRC